MSIERKQTNARMSQVVVDAGIVYLSGQLPTPDSGDTVREQTTHLLDRVDLLLSDAGSDKGRLLTATIWLRDIGAFDEMNAVWEAWLPEGAAPARACVETRFPFQHVLVEIQVSARQF